MPLVVVVLFLVTRVDLGDIIGTNKLSGGAVSRDCLWIEFVSEAPFTGTPCTFEVTVLPIVRSSSFSAPGLF